MLLMSEIIMRYLLTGKKYSQIETHKEFLARLPNIERLARCSDKLSLSFAEFRVTFDGTAGTVHLDDERQEEVCWLPEQG